MSDALLVLNAGSSSLKFSVFLNQNLPQPVVRGQIDAEEGVRRYGFHGLSYEYIASVLPTIDRRAAEGRTVLAHLGNGASMCALSGGRSVATTMSFTPLDGLVMGTRCGATDAGVPPVQAVQRVEIVQTPCLIFSRVAEKVRGKGLNVLNGLTIGTFGTAGTIRRLAKVKRGYPRQ